MTYHQNNQQNDAQATRVRPQITIRVCGSLALVTPALPAIVASLLHYDVDEFEAQGGRMRHYRHAVQVYRTCNGGDQLVPAGSVPWIIRSLRNEGYDSVVEHLPEPEEPVLVVDPMYQLGQYGEARAFLEAVNKEPRGQIILHDQETLADCIAVIARMYGRAKIMVVVSTLKHQKELSYQLQCRLGQCVGWASTAFWSSEKRIVVATHRSVECGEPWHWHLLLLADAKSIVLKRPDNYWEDFLQKRVYGFIKAGKRFSRQVQLRLEMCCGPVIYTAPDPRGDLAQVEVMLADYTAGPVTCPEGGLARKRAAIWQHAARNDAIAGVAQGFAERNLEAMWRHGIMLDRDEDWFTRMFSSLPPSVAVLVDSPEHAQALLQRLPGWRLIKYGVPVQPVFGPQRDIVTTVAANKLYDMTTGIIIRADGDSGPLPIVKFPPRSEPGNSRQIVLVDLADEFDDQAREATLVRLQNYASQGFALDARSDSRLAQELQPVSKRAPTQEQKRKR